MLLSINEDKLVELLKTSSPGYSVSTSDLPVAAVEESQAYPMNYSASGATYGAPQMVTPEARENLLAARHRIEASGVKLKSAEELAEEINEMRRVR